MKKSKQHRRKQSEEILWKRLKETAEGRKNWLDATKFQASERECNRQSNAVERLEKLPPVNPLALDLCWYRRSKCMEFF